MRFAVIFFFGFLIACTDPSIPPQPQVRLVGDVRDAVIEGAQVWEELGFQVSTTDYGLPECPLDWFATDVDRLGCVITVEFRDDPNQYEIYGTVGQALPPLRRIYIDTLTAWDPDFVDSYRIVSAHELGHILLMTADHLPADQDGLMGGGNMGQLSPDDYGFACERIGVCL